MAKAFSTAIATEKPNVKWDDIAGLKKAKYVLQEAIILPSKFPQLFVGKLRPWGGILLYGPPGTGKSFLVKACGSEVQARFFSVDLSDLITKWLGKSEKLFRSLFEMPKASLPAIIFIDETDFLNQSCKSGDNDSSRGVLTQFLVQMQGMYRDSIRWSVLGATNKPWEVDRRVIKRLEKRVYVPLPEKSARKKMFKLHLGDTPSSLTEEDLEILAEYTEGYSGSDIFSLVKDALMEPKVMVEQEAPY